MFIVALFTIAETWRQRKYPLKEEWIKKMWCVYAIEFYSVTQHKIEIMPLAGKT